MFQAHGLGLPMAHPQAPYGTQSQSTQELPTIGGGAPAEIACKPALAGVKEFLTAKSDGLPRAPP